VTQALDVFSSAEAAGRLSSEALANLRVWLTDPALAEFRDEIVALVDGQHWDELEDAFYKRISIGTGGIRGRIGPGPNRINTRIIGEAAQALAEFILVRGASAREAGIVVGHEARRGSRAFASMCCEVFAANGIRSYLFDGVRSTPEISFAVRHLQTTAGVQITASHNPRTDNGFKFYWTYGGQVVPPLDAEFMQLVRGVSSIARVDFDRAQADGLIHMVSKDVDTAYLEAVKALSIEPNRSARIVFSAMHGAGSTNVLPVLESAGFAVDAVNEQLEPDERFPTAAGDLINPEYLEVMQLPIERANAHQADLAICSDPDADRAGIAARRAPDSTNVELLRGDDVGAALTHYLLERRKAHGLSSPQDIVLTTFVTTSLIGETARHFQTEVIDDLLVGFKWMASEIQAREDAGKLGFAFATEESIGYMAGNFVRDKDAATGALLVAELASWLKDRGETIWTYLDSMYARLGYFRNLQQLVELPGKAGMLVMREVMLGLRSSPPDQIGGYPVKSVIDRLPEDQRGRQTYQIGRGDDMLTLVLSDDLRNRVTVRPSGTEPKLKYYVQLYEPHSGDLPTLKARLDQLSLAVANGVVDASGSVIGAQLEAAEAERLRAEWQRGVRRLV
jgi:phosphoglucomutase